MPPNTEKIGPQVFTRRMALGERPGKLFDVELTLDVDRVMMQLAWRARGNRSKRSHIGGGSVSCLIKEVKR